MSKRRSRWDDRDGLGSHPEPPQTQLLLSLESIVQPAAAVLDDNLNAQSRASSYTDIPCLLPFLHPVRHCLHTFLSAKDAVMLMRASRATTTALLADYTFLDHVFAYHDVADVKRSLTLYAHYHMRITRMTLPFRWNEAMVDSATGLPWLPRSLVALMLGQRRSSDSRRCAVDEACYKADSVAMVDVADGATVFERLARPVDQDTVSWVGGWSVSQYGLCLGTYNQPIPPGTLPHGLRFLQLSDHYNQPLQPGSIPDSVEVLEFGLAFNQPLEAGHLPASLTHLVLGERYNHPLAPGVLPSKLRQLRLSDNLSQLLQPGMLPSQLQQLRFGYSYNQPICPGAIPSSVTHLRLSTVYNQPLQPGSLPSSLVHLNLGEHFSYPLLPGVLPASLRQLVVSVPFNHPLQPGSLPDGLEVLAFHPESYFQQPLLSGVLPASVLAVSLGENYSQPLVAGGIPATVKWLRLPRRYNNQDLSVLSPDTRLVCWLSY